VSRVSRAEVALGTPPYVDIEPESPVTEVEKPPTPTKGKGKPSTDPETEEPTA
jgi:hypothetical protein